SRPGFPAGDALDGVAGAEARVAVEGFEVELHETLSSAWREDAAAASACPRIGSTVNLNSSFTSGQRRIVPIALSDQTISLCWALHECIVSAGMVTSASPAAVWLSRRAVWSSCTTVR